MRTRNLIAGLAVAGLSLAGGNAVTAAPITSGLQIHLSADAGVTESGGAVSAWQSQAGNILTLEQSDEALRPTYVSSVAELGGAAAIQFSRTNRDLGTFLTGSMSAAFDANNATVFMVGSISEVARSMAWELRPATGEDEGFGMARGSVTDGAIVHHWDNDGTGARLQTDNEIKVDDNYHILTTNVDKASGLIDVFIDGIHSGNGINPTLASTVALNDIVSVTMGGRKGGDEWILDGSIAEILVYDRILSESEMNEVGYYLQEKHGLAGAYVPEPASLVLMGAGGMMLLRRRR